MVNADLSRVINSDEVQYVVKPNKKNVKRHQLKNSLKNLNAMLKLNPYAKTGRRMALLAEKQCVKVKKEKLDKKRNLTTKDLTDILICSQSKVMLPVETYLGLSWIPMKNVRGYFRTIRTLFSEDPGELNK